MTSIWSPRKGLFDNRKPNMAQCRASVWDRQVWSRDYQCSRKATCERVVDGQTYGFCKQHDPVVGEARRKETHQRWDREAAERAENRRIEALMPECKAALEKIAAGHNDPRSLAIEILAKFAPRKAKAA